MAVALLIPVASGCPMPMHGGHPGPVEANADGTVSTVAGAGVEGYGHHGGAATQSLLNSPTDVALTSGGSLLIADSMNHRIRAIDLATGLISTIAGDGGVSGPDSLNTPVGVSPTGDGGFHVAAWGGHRVYAYAPNGIRSVLIGTGLAECQVLPGNADMATVFAPRSMAVLADGSVLISEQGCHRLLRVAMDGEVSAYAGTGTEGYSGDDGPATDASLRAGALTGPSFGISLSPEDPPDELFIADTGNHVIREIDVFSRRIETVAGTGEPGFLDGTLDEAQFNRPVNVFAGADHSLWVVDAGNHAIRYIDPLGTRVTTVVGTGAGGFNGDGLDPAETQLRDPQAVWVDDAGRVFIADTGNHRIRLYSSR